MRFRRRIVVSAGVLAEPGLTADGLALILCHELGHHYGGYPFQKSDKLTTAEGSADYFATRVCGPVVLRALGDGPPPSPVARKRCQANGSDLPLCARLLSASLALAQTLHAHIEDMPEALPPYTSAEEAPSLERQDEFEVDRTVAAHYPSLQCRLDTLVRGALCGLAVSRELREPGSADTEADALAQSCSVATFEPGARPRCWFREGSTPTGANDPDDVVWKGH